MISKNFSNYLLLFILLSISFEANSVPSESSTVTSDQDDTLPQLTADHESSENNTSDQHAKEQNTVTALPTSEGASADQSEDTTGSSERKSTILEVNTHQGTANGVNFVTRNGRSISGFLGIPYAQPPTGNLRFKSPMAADAWNGTLDATKDQNVCPQLSGSKVIGNEDCLYLNVYTPQIPTDKSPKLLPVMVYIHSGGFERGSGSSSHYSPEYLLDKDVLLVAPNYRLGVLGFLSTGDDVAPGNYGLKDMVLALKWVQKNIAQFGGDADQVTVFGQGAGAGAAELLTLSNSTDGLFQKYISESGSAFSIRNFRSRKAYASRATELGGFLGCPTSSSSQLVDCLKKLNASEIVSTKSSFYEWKTFPDLVWGPTDEPDADEAFITDTPTKLYAAGHVSDLPRITGAVLNEGLILSAQFYTNPDMLDEFVAKFDEVLPHVLQYHNNVADEEDFTKALKAYYFNDLNADRKVLLTNLTTIIGDSMYIYPVYNGLQYRLARPDSVDYFYSFQYRGTYSFSYKYSGGSTENYGVSHSDELLYLFPHLEPILEKEELGKEMSEADYEMVDNMVQLWTSFAINGTPFTSELNGITGWSKHSRENNYLLIGDEEKVVLQMHYFFHSDRMQFWKRLNATKSSDEGSLSSEIWGIIDATGDFIVYILSSVFDLLFFWV